jgi:4-hydroxy-tetrahydrodipicolinate reductase
MRIVIVGGGRMGKAVEAVATEQGHTVHALVSGSENLNGEALTAERLAGADVAIEFTRPASVVSNLRRLIEAGIPVVTGTTGWAATLPEIERLVSDRGGALLYSPNFSIGVQLFLRAAADLARRFAGRPEFSGTILEEHHAAKVDAPSGTALRLRDMVRAVEPQREFPITSVRAGFIPGRHTLTFDAPHETVRLEHEARSRAGFAAGALAAAEWLKGRKGIFRFEDMLFGGTP